jgi:Lon protease-like protein
MNKMETSGSLIKTIPFFPLGMIILPGEEIPLRVFEPRYKQLINDVLATGDTFGIPYVQDSKIREHGCEVRVSKVVMTAPNGEMVIMIKGVSMFRLIDFNDTLPGKLYSGGRIERQAAKNLSRDTELITLVKDNAPHVPSLETLPVDSQVLDLNELAKALGLSFDEKYQFASTTSQTNKERYLVCLLKIIQVLRDQEDELDFNFNLN